MDNIVYKIENDRLWSVIKAKWIDTQELSSMMQADPELEIVNLVNANGISDKKYLIKTLEFYKYPLGELALDSITGIKEALAKLDHEYLTDRTLAGLATGDPISLERWQEHETKAIPLREKLNLLEEQENQ